MMPEPVIKTKLWYKFSMNKNTSPEAYHVRDMLGTTIAAISIANVGKVESTMPAPLPFDGDDVAGNWEL